MLLIHPQLVLRHDDEGVPTLTMNRPQARNALSQGMLRALLDTFIEVSTDEAARVVILAGAGPGFCAGHLLQNRSALEYSRHPSIQESLCRLLFLQIFLAHGLP